MTLHKMFDTTETVFISANHNWEAINPVLKCGNCFRSVLIGSHFENQKSQKNGWICCWYCLYFYIMNIHAIRICDIVRQGNVPACILSHLLSEYLKHDPHVLVLMQKNTVDLLGANTFLFSFLFSERILRSLPPKTPRLGAELNLLSRHIAEQPSGLPRCLSARCKV